jgi:protein-L-isoaspartate(D-aspartate) O-methyltransferase
MNGWLKAYTARMLSELTAQKIHNDQVLQAMKQTPRHEFLDAALIEQSFQNTPLPIGYGQVISDPYQVALMAQLLLQQQGSGTVLEVGTGSGYQTAVLARLFPKVASMERIRALQIQARQRLKQHDLHHVRLKCGDGLQGWAAKGPYQGIVLSGAVTQLPEALLAQLSVGGCLLAVVGKSRSNLVRVVRQSKSYDIQSIQPMKMPSLTATMAGMCL